MIFLDCSNHSGKNAKSTCGKRCSSSWTSYLPRERGEMITQVGIIGASGLALPPIWIFPRVRENPSRILANLPSGPMALAHKSGWMTSDNFVKVLQFLVNFIRCSNDRKVLLILDNHQSHINIEAITFAKENGIVLLAILPHTSNKLQPLDLTVFEPIKTFVRQGINDWMISNPGKTISIYDLPLICSTAWDRAATSVNIKSGFSSSGIFPLDRSIFSDQDFLCSAVTDRPLARNEEQRENSSDKISQTASISIPTSVASPNLGKFTHDVGYKIKPKKQGFCLLNVFVHIQRLLFVIKHRRKSVTKVEQ